MKKNILIVIAFLAIQQSFAQTLYNVNTIQKIEIYFSISDWDYRLDTAKHGAEAYLMADWVKINGFQYDSVGVKYKGNSSYDSTRKKNPVHISFDEFKNQNHDGYKDIKLSNAYGDPSSIREVLSYSILKNYMHCPKANFAQLYINGVYIGIYSSAENIDKKFCADHFYSNQGTFVKCNPISNPGPTSKSNFRFLTTDSTSYFPYYEIKSKYGWNELVKLCDTITNNTTSFENNVDVDRVIWMLAFNNLFVNLDSYSGVFAQNHYTYRDNTNHFNPIIWDLNMCFGAFPFAGVGNTSMGNQTPNSMKQFSPANHAADIYWPLINIIQSNSSYKKKYIAHIKTMMNEIIISNQYNVLATQFNTLIDTAILADINSLYTYAQFQSAMNTDIINGSYTIPGINNLMTGRAIYLQSLPEFIASAPVISAITPSNVSPIYNSTVTIQATVANTNTVTIGYRFNKKLKFQKATMFDDGAHNDGIAGDNIFGADIVITGADMQYYIYAENNDAGIFAPQRAEHEYFYLIVSNVIPVAGDIVINEILAENKNNERDEYNNNEDWIELYNTTSQTINLSNIYLSDTNNNLSKWKFPDSTFITPYGYITVWADDDSLEQILHTNFNLRKDTGQLIVSNGITMFDMLSYGPQMADTSWGRYPNGTGNFILMNTTFGYENNNSPLSNFSFYKNINSIKLFPNPANESMTVNFIGNKYFTILNENGKKINSFFGKEKIQINTSKYKNGIYFLQHNHELIKFIVAH